MKPYIIVLLLFLSTLVSAGTTTVTGTIHDPSAQTYANGTVTAIFQPNIAYGINATVGGVPVTPVAVAGSMNGSGVFSITLTDNSTVSPPGSTWAITVCPQASAPCVTVGGISIVGASLDVSSIINPAVPNIQVTPSNRPPYSAAYADSEIVGPVVGTTYYNVTDFTLHVYNGVAFFSVGGSGLPSGCTGTPGNITCNSFTSNSAGIGQLNSAFGAGVAPTGVQGSFLFGPNGFMSYYPAGGANLGSFVPPFDFYGFCNLASQTNGNYVRINATADCLEATGANLATGPPFLGSGGTSAAPDYSWANCTSCGLWLDTSGSSIKIAVWDAIGGTRMMYNSLCSSTANAPCKQVSIGFGNGDSLKSYYASGPVICGDKNGNNDVPCINLAQSISGVTHYSDSGAAGNSIDHIVTNYGGVATVLNGQPINIYATASAADNTNGTTTAVTMVTAPAATTWYKVTFYILQTVAGTSCTGNTTITPKLLFTDPNAAGQSTIAGQSVQIVTNGTANTPVMPTTATSWTFPAKASTTVQYVITYAIGSACSPGPTVVVTPILEQL